MGIIVIDDPGAKTKREAVELGLLKLVQLGKQIEVLKMRGKLHWEGDLETMRKFFPAVQ